jgi:hypothetical protein
LDKSIEQFILVAPVLLFSMVAHEYAHGYAALKQGDTTAYALGRLTWNPIPHIDLFMTILLPLLTTSQPESLSAASRCRLYGAIIVTTNAATGSFRWPASPRTS